MLPDIVTGGLAVAGGFIVVIGYAMVLNMMMVKYLAPFFYLDFVLGGYLNFSLLSFGILGVIFAILYVQLNSKFNTSKNNEKNIVANNYSIIADDELDD